MDVANDAHKIILDNTELHFEDIIADYKLALASRQTSLIGRREVLSGKAKFGIFGDGKEVAQIALAKVWQKGDFRSGYYRDQTLMFALGITSIGEQFAQLYAHADVEAEPMSGGRGMNAHFATRSLNPDGSWKNLMEMYNTSSDISPTGGQMPRLVGLGYASKLYRHLPELDDLIGFSAGGDEVAFGTIGNASCAEGLFWEAINAIGVLQVPVVLSIWDDGYGISVPNEYQVTKGNISTLLEGFQRTEESNGFDIYTVKGWDYPELVNTFIKATQTARVSHVPAVIHVQEVTQPEGHSTSGSHERYKSKQRLEWEKQFDPIKKMGEWMVSQGIASEDELEAWAGESRQEVEAVRIAAWKAFQSPMKQEAQDVADILDEIAMGSSSGQALGKLKRDLLGLKIVTRTDIMETIRDSLLVLRDESNPTKQVLIEWKLRQHKINSERYNSYLYSQSADSAMRIKGVKPVYSASSPRVSGFEILQAYFESLLERDPRVIVFGEDVGKIGGVNQGMAGLQQKFGELRVTDTGIRETTILGQGIGMALRGLRPITEIQYLDYVLFALQTMSDDLATLHWRTKGGQKAPVVIRTRGHRLEGVWHSGSLMAGLIHLVRGIHVLVPRDMTQAAGFYNSLMAGDEPGLVVEVLNGYRLKERLPDNVADVQIPLGVPEVLRPGRDITIVTYGAMCRIVLKAADLLADVNIDAEVIDVQSLLPFDIHHKILESLKKTSRILFTDEDVPGGTTAYMMQEVIEKQGGYHWLDSEPRTLASRPHRPAYGSDGDYWSKPSVDSVFEAVYELMNEADPASYPIFYR